MTRTPSRGLEIEGYPVEGVSIGGKETCVIFPTLSLAFDIGVGVGPPTAFKQEFLFVSHGHLDHIGGLPAYVAAREFLSLPPPTIFVPACLGDLVAQLFQSYRAISVTDLPHILVPLEVGKEYEFRTDLKVRAFKTYHAIPSQGYVIYTMKKKLKQEFIGLPGSEIKRLRSSGVEVTDTVSTPEIAFTGDTTSDFILDPNNSDVLAAKILVVETTFLDNSISVEHAREYGHTHLSEVASLSEKLGNKAILLIHFSARYTSEEIDAAINTLPPTLRSRVYAMKVNTHALSGGKDSNERNLDEDVLIRYLEFFLEDDDELHKIKKGYKGGAMSSDQVKQHLVTTLAEVLCWHQRARAELSEEVLDVFMAPRPLPSMFEPSS